MTDYPFPTMIIRGFKCLQIFFFSSMLSIWDMKDLERLHGYFHFRI